MSVKCMLDLFVFRSVSHRTLTWTTGSLTWGRDHSYACIIYTHTGSGSNPGEGSMQWHRRGQAAETLCLRGGGKRGGGWGSESCLLVAECRALKLQGHVHSLTS